MSDDHRTEIYALLDDYRQALKLAEPIYKPNRSVPERNEQIHADLRDYERFTLRMSQMLEERPDAYRSIAANYFRSSSVARNALKLIEEGQKPPAPWLRCLNPLKEDPMPSQIWSRYEASGVTALLAISAPPRQRIVSGHADGTINVRNTANGQLQHCLRSRNTSVEVLATSHDGNVLLAAHWDNTIDLWCLKTGLLDSSTSLGFTTGGQTALAVSLLRDGKFAVCDGHRDRVFVFSRACTLIRQMRLPPEITVRGEFPSDFGYGVAIAVTEDELHACNSEGVLYSWNLNATNELPNRKIPLEHAEPFLTFASAFSPNGNQIASRDSRSGALVVWNVKTGRRVFRADAGSASLNRNGQISWADDANVLTNSNNGSIRLWHVVRRLSRQTYVLGWDFIRYFAPLRNAAGVAVCGGGLDNSIRVVSGAIHDHTIPPKKCSNPVSLLFFMPKRQQLLSFQRGYLSLINSEDGSLLAELDTSDLKRCPRWQASICPTGTNDEKEVVLFGTEKTVTVWNTATNSHRRRLRRSVTLVEDPFRIVLQQFSPQWISRPFPGREYLSLKEYDSYRCRSVAVPSLDGTRVLEGCSDGHVKFWGAHGKHLIWQAREQTESIWGVSLSSDVTVGVTIGQDEPAFYVWSCLEGRLITKVAVDAPICSVAMSRELPVRIAVGTAYGDVCIWELDGCL